MALDVIALARVRLKQYLDAEYAAEDPPNDTVVREVWPDANETLERRTVTIVIPEARATTRYWDPEPFAQSPNTADLTGMTVLADYSYGSFKLPIQVDVWANYPNVRDEMVARLMELLFRHPSETLGTDTHPRLRAWPELALQVDLEPEAPGFIAYYRFDDIPMPVEGQEEVQGGEHRAVLQGTVEGLLTSREVVAVMRELDVLLFADPDPSTVPDAATLDPDADPINTELFTEP